LKEVHKQKQNMMKHYKAVITDEKSTQFGLTIATTKSSKYKNMTLAEFEEATKSISALRISIRPL